MQLQTRLLQLGVLAATAKYPLSASAERAFANFRDKYFTIANFCDKNVVFRHFGNKNLFLQILQEKTVVFYNCMKTSIFTVLQSSQMILVHMLQ